MKLLVFGRTGQVARALARQLPPNVTADFVGREAVDLRDSVCVREAIRRSDADAVVNAAAWTAVDAAEDAEEEVFAVNATAPAVMAQETGAQRKAFVHLSTAYVFGGDAGPYRPSDGPRPRSVYGRSKRAGELGVLEANGCAVVLRTCWVFGEGRNLVNTLQRVTGHRSVVHDQIAGPTPAVRLADAVFVIARRLRHDPTVAGLHHFSGTPDVSYADFARRIVSTAELDVTIDPIPTSAWPSAAVRPADARLDGTTLLETFGIPRPDWTLDLPRSSQ